MLPGFFTSCRGEPQPKSDLLTVLAASNSYFVAFSFTGLIHLGFAKIISPNVTIRCLTPFRNFMFANSMSRPEHCAWILLMLDGGETWLCLGIGTVNIRFVQAEAG